MKLRDFLILSMTLLCAQVQAQSQFSYKRSISGVTQDGWYDISLPPAIFRHLNNDITDFRLYQLNETDTVEIPYLRQIHVDEVIRETVLLPLFNKSYRNGVLYLMFELKNSRQVNHLDLAFAETNYFGFVSIEGSDDRKKWFEISKDQRIVSIGNNSTDYTLSAVDFPVTDYRFLRVSVRSDTPLTFRKASFAHHVTSRGAFHDIPLTWRMTTDKKSGTSFVDIDLQHYMPVNSLQVLTDSAGHYYRSFRIEYVRDSVQTEKGWLKYYGNLYEGHLTSYAPNDFTFDWTVAKELRLVIRDMDNAALAIQELSAKGPDVRVISRLQPGNNFIFYGASGLRPPSYDLAFFENKIPKQLARPQLGEEERIAEAQSLTSPLFENKIWLWGVMGVMILGLAFFTIQMMKKA
jgi:hypothetical protein